MAIYHINKGIGKASSGIEYAQSYRNQLFSELGVKQHFIFMDYIGSNIITFTEKMGFVTDEVLYAHGIMAHQKNHSSAYPLEKFERRINQISERHVKEEFSEFWTIRLLERNLLFRVWKTGDGYVDRVDFVKDNRLMMVEHYSDRLTNIEYYTTGILSSRTFFDENGDVAYRQYYEDGEIELTVFKDQVLRGRHEFQRAFFQQLNWNEDDLVIIDRGLDLADAVFASAGEARLAVVVHAEHYSEKFSTKQNILWNNHYDYMFTNSRLVDWFIVPTYQQKNKLTSDFEVMDQETKGIRVIPVGYVPSVYPNFNIKAKRYRLMTASRLAPEKNIDLLISAVAEARKTLPELTLTVYGEGGERQSLEKLIQELDAQAYITLAGHQSLEDVYGNYGAYVSASGSEGFGLSLLEAISYGLPMIGFEVPYGNTEFVAQGVNGFLVPKGEKQQNIIGLTKAIQDFCSETFDIEKASAKSIEKASEYTAEKVKTRWSSLLLEMLNDKN